MGPLAFGLQSKALRFGWVGLAIASCASSRQAPPVKLFTEHNLVAQDLTALENNPREWRALWWKHFTDNAKLYADTQNARTVMKEFRRGQQAKLEKKNESGEELGLRMRAHYHQLRLALGKALAKFHAQIPLREPLDVYWLWSIHPFNGKEFLTDGRPAMAFNLSYPKFEESETELLILHEALHVVHMRRLGARAHLLFDTPWGIVMREGLAVYASKLLSPALSDQQYSFLSPTDFTDCQTNRARYARELIKLLKRGATFATNDRFFSARPQKNPPPRCGYFLAYRAIELARANLSLEQMLSLPAAKYEKLLEEGLKSLGTQEK